MKKLLTALFVVAVTASVAQAGIEVLGIEVLQNGNRGIEVLCTQCPAGSNAEYVTVVNGIEVLLDAAPVNPTTGLAYLEVPVVRPGDFVRVRGPDGVVYGIEVL